MLDRVAKGEEITITRHGIPAAVRIPVAETVAKLPHKEIVEGMRALRKRVKHGKMSVKDIVNEGRRYFQKCGNGVPVKAASINEEANA